MLAKHFITAMALALATHSVHAAEAAKAAPATNQAAAVVPSQAAEAAPAAAVTQPEGRQLKHRFGVGLDSIPGASAPISLGGLATVPNALGLRFWFTEKLGLDLRLAFDGNSVANGTTGTATDGGASWGVGLGAKYNLTRPSRDLLTQLVARTSLGGNAQGDTGAGNGRASVSEFSLFFGVGFEAFVPGWDWISLEGSAGWGTSTRNVVPDNRSNQVSQSSSRLYLGGEGFNPLNLALHFYF